MVKKFLLVLLALSIFNSSGYAKIKTKSVLTDKANLRKKNKKKTPTSKKIRKLSHPTKKTPLRVTVAPKVSVKKTSPFKVLTALSRRKEQERFLQQQLEAERKRQENMRQQSSLRQQERARIQHELLAAQQRQTEYAQRRQEEESLAQQHLLRARMEQKINGHSLKNDQDMSLTKLLMNGYYGQMTTIAAIERNVYHTLSPTTGDRLIAGVINEWYFRYKGQILPRLSL